MTAMPWFRLYNETKDDPKIKRVIKLSGQIKPVVIGVWTTILCLASESPERGKLLITADMPYTAEEIMDECGIDPEAGGQLLVAFMELGMITEEEGVYLVTAWDGRQFDSDSSNERVRRHRAGKRQAQNQPEEPPKSSSSAPNGPEPAPEAVTLQQRYSNGDVTLQQRYSNGPDSDSETDPESESECVNKDSLKSTMRAREADTHTVKELALAVLETCGFSDLSKIHRDTWQAINAATRTLFEWNESPERVRLFRENWRLRDPPTPRQILTDWQRILSGNGASPNGRHNPRAGQTGANGAIEKRFNPRTSETYWFDRTTGQRVPGPVS